eukprot:TRINITY_DN8256_c0_g1_i1.p1 TRINITY_DN8256_c0_g1~~TRINITY_DN8256_c0_g1_i1.p1  ORF type:complete len:419 (+),score=120.29 TRINITY_DN8256_c0_g1_i1:62-1258(+)
MAAELTAEEEKEFQDAKAALKQYYYHTGPLPFTAPTFDYSYEGWSEDDLDEHRLGVKINGCSGFPRQVHWMQAASWLFIVLQTTTANAINLPLLPYPGNLVCSFLFNFAVAWLIVSNAVCCLTQSADPAVFGTKRWTKKEYLLWLRIKCETHVGGPQDGTLIIPTQGHPLKERPIGEIRHSDGSLVPRIEALVQAHPYSRQVREALPIVNATLRASKNLLIRRGELKQPLYPKRRWDPYDHCMVLHDSYHCHGSNKSVQGMDHFCKWLNSSIGDANYKYFASFSLTIFWAELMHFGIGLFQIIDSFKDEQWYRVRIESVYPDSSFDASLHVVRVFLFVALMLSIGVIIQLAWLYGFHVMLWRLGHDDGGRTTLRYWQTAGETEEQVAAAAAAAGPQSG